MRRRSCRRKSNGWWGPKNKSRGWDRKKNFQGRERENDVWAESEKIVLFYDFYPRLVGRLAAKKK